MDGESNTGHRNTLADRLNVSPASESVQKCDNGKRIEGCDSETSKDKKNASYELTGEAKDSCDNDKCDETEGIKNDLEEVEQMSNNDVENVSETVTQLDISENRTTEKNDANVETCNSKEADESNNQDAPLQRDSAVGGENSCDTFVDSCENVEEEDGSEESGSDEDYESAEEGEEIQTDTQNLRDLEESLTEEEKEEKRKSAQELKEEGNEYFRSGSYKTAIKAYSRALRACPLKFVRDRAIMYSNRAACKMKLDDLDGAIRDSGKAVELHPHYLKALMRRAELYERTEKLDEALADFQRILELDPSQYSARAACARLPDMIKDRNEKMKDEMMSKLKDLGNLVLRPFGLSTNNFQLNQDPNSGGYSVNFVQNADQNTDQNANTQ